MTASSKRFEPWIRPAFEKSAVPANRTNRKLAACVSDPVNWASWHPRPPCAVLKSKLASEANVTPEKSEPPPNRASLNEAAESKVASVKRDCWAKFALRKDATPWKSALLKSAPWSKEASLAIILLAKADRKSVV